MAQQPAPSTPAQKQPTQIQVTYAAPAPAPQPQVVMMGNSVAGQQYPCTVKCPFCQNIVATRVDKTWSTADILVIVVGLFIWPVLYILCCSPFHDINHYCTRCGVLIGKA